jgi:hypothetical protein
MTSDEAIKLTDNTDMDPIPVKNLGHLYAIILANLGTEKTPKQIPGWLFEYLDSKGVKTSTAKVVWLLIEAFLVKFGEGVENTSTTVPKISK